MQCKVGHYFKEGVRGAKTNGGAEKQHATAVSAMGMGGEGGCKAGCSAKQGTALRRG